MHIRIYIYIYSHFSSGESKWAKRARERRGEPRLWCTELGVRAIRTNYDGARFTRRRGETGTKRAATAQPEEGKRERAPTGGRCFATNSRHSTSFVEARVLPVQCCYVDSYSINLDFWMNSRDEKKRKGTLPSPYTLFYFTQKLEISCFLPFCDCSRKRESQ